MVVTARLRERIEGRMVAPSLEIGPLVPVLLALAVVAGLTLLLSLRPIGSGDYGQWLMTSRYYLGVNVPEYREVSALPPAVPLLLALIRVFVADPLVALHLLSALILVALGSALYLAGSLLLRNAWAGAVTLAVSLVITDRFIELFAFGGLLQLTSMAFMVLSVAAFTRAGSGDELHRTWWFTGMASVALAAMSHVGTGLIAVPVALVSASLALLTQRRHGRRLLLPVLTLLACLGLVAIYWLLFLLPASATYVSNPATMAFRGPDRLFELLLARWPTTILVVLGWCAIVLGAVRGIVLRRLDGYVVAGAWASVTWGILLYSIVTGSATDYPRFATPLLAPLMVGSAGAVLWALRALRVYLRGLGVPATTAAVRTTAVLGIIVLAAPFAVQRYSDQSRYYELRAPASLTAAAHWIDAKLGDQQTVLTEVRDGKWLEGLTGRAALFSQPVRYAYRPVEWQRSVDANALLRSTGGVTSGYVSGSFTRLAERHGRSAPTGLLISANHGGEFLDLLQIGAADTTLRASDGRLSAGELHPVKMSRHAIRNEATIKTVWAGAGEPEVSFVQSVTAYEHGTTLRVTQSAPRHRLQTTVRPVARGEFASLDIHGAEAIACFTYFGSTQPCVRIHVTHEAATLTGTKNGALRVASRRGEGIDLLVTALTPGEASVGLQLMNPADIVTTYDVGAVLLNAADDAALSRQRRLETLGFREAHDFGPYRVLLRDGTARR